MNSKIARTLLALAFTFASTALMADVKADRTRKAADELDNTVKKVELRKSAPHLAKLLKADSGTVADAVVTRNMKFSDVALAQLIAEKRGQSLATVLQSKPEPDWLSAMPAANISWDNAYEHLDNLNMEAAFLMLDLRDKK